MRSNRQGAAKEKTDQSLGAGAATAGGRVILGLVMAADRDPAIKKRMRKFVADVRAQRGGEPGFDHAAAFSACTPKYSSSGVLSSIEECGRRAL
jgi:hypothetical protein